LLDRVPAGVQPDASCGRVLGAGGQRLEPLRFHVDVKGRCRRECDLVTAGLERPRKWDERPEVAVERSGREQNAHLAIISHGNHGARATV